MSDQARDDLIPAVYGLTGGIASGKTTVSDTFASLGIRIVDTDVVARALTAPGGKAMPQIVTQFGQAITAADGSMDRAKMRDIVFADPAQRQRLEGILHPLIHQECESQLNAPINSQQSSIYQLIVVPLMTPNSHWVKRCSRIIVVDCTEQQQLSRLMQRSGLTASQAQAIIDTQITREQRLSIATDVLNNHGDRANLIEQVHRLHLRLSNP